MQRYFAYGCNVEPAHMRRLAPSARALGLAVLADHRLTFPRGCNEWAGGVASVKPALGATVEGVLYDVDDAALAAIDAYEEVEEGAYRREVVTVRHGGGSVEAWVYVAAPETGGPFAPSQRYCDALVTGLTAVGASAAYIRAIGRLTATPPAYTTAPHGKDLP